MKITKAQQRVYDELVSNVTEARESGSFDAWFAKAHKGMNPNYKEMCRGSYENLLHGVCSIYKAKDETLKKLESLGLIKIVNLKTNLIQLIERRN